jgi:hypothetical protein
MKEKAMRLIDYTQRMLSMEAFKRKHRTSEQHFTRRSKLNFKNTTVMTLRTVKKSAKVELMDCFYDLDEEIEIPQRQSFSAAREKISYAAFKELFDKSCEIAIEGDGARTYKGYRLLAVDGTSFVVGSLNKMKEYFGESTAITDHAMCRIGAIVDVLEESIVTACAKPLSIGERAIAIEQIETLSFVTNALYLFDRGYWSPNLTANILRNGQKFLMRLASNINKTCVVDENGNEYALRRYSFTLPGGNVETLLTNIPEEEMPDEELAALYAKRWGIETKYLELKELLQIDRFSGETANIVLQDIYSTLYVSNLIAFICLEPDAIIKAKTAGKDNKYEQKTNRAACIAVVRKRFIDIFMMDDPVKRSTAFDRLHRDISKCVTYIGKSKPIPRNKHKLKNKRKSKAKSFL